MMKWEREAAPVLILDVTDYVLEQTNSESISGDEAGDGSGVVLPQNI